MAYFVGVYWMANRIKLPDQSVQIVGCCPEYLHPPTQRCLMQSRANLHVEQVVHGQVAQHRAVDQMFRERVTILRQADVV